MNWELWVVFGLPVTLAVAWFLMRASSGRWPDEAPPTDEPAPMDDPIDGPPNE